MDSTVGKTDVLISFYIQVKTLRIFAFASLSPHLGHSPILPSAKCRAVVNTAAMYNAPKDIHTMVSRPAGSVPCASNRCALGKIILQPRGTGGERSR